MSGHVVSPRDACSALELLFWNGTVVPVRAVVDGREERFAFPLRPPGRRPGQPLGDLVARLDHTLSADVLLGLPRVRAGHGTAEPVSVLWARVEGKAQAAALRRFRPGPHLVLREGGAERYVAFWGLQAALSWEWAVRANKRLAHALKAAKKWADPDTFEFPAPGSVLRDGRKRPAVVSVARCELPDGGVALPSVRDVVGRLRDAPDADAWRKAVAA